MLIYSIVILNEKNITRFYKENISQLQIEGKL